MTSPSDLSDVYKTFLIVKEGKVQGGGGTPQSVKLFFGGKFRKRGEGGSPLICKPNIHWKMAQK